MNSLPLTLQIVLVVPILVVATFVLGAPELFGNWIAWKRDEMQREAAQQAELDRKIAIAEAASAARARGERFVPPADYDR